MLGAGVGAAIEVIVRVVEPTVLAAGLSTVIVLATVSMDVIFENEDTPDPSTLLPTWRPSVVDTLMITLPSMVLPVTVVTRPSIVYVGARVGDAVGALLGLALGLGVGLSKVYVGSSVGDTVGALLGEAEGLGVGVPAMYAGACVGAAVGGMMG